jgi:hypothetical protein
MTVWLISSRPLVLNPHLGFSLAIRALEPCPLD